MMCSEGNSATDQDVENRDCSTEEATSEASDQTEGCRLSEPEQEARRQGIGRLLSAAAEEIHEVDDGLTLRYPGHPAMARAVLDFVESERRCCPYLTFELELEPAGGPIELTLRGEREVGSSFSEELARIQPEDRSEQPDPGPDSAVRRALEMIGPIEGEQAGLDGAELGRLTRAVLDRLMEMKPVEVEEIARLSKLSLARTRVLLDQLGAERDDQGRIVGLGLTLEPTPHEYRAEGRKLYTWCAPDALLYPYVLDHTAEVRSTDPVSEERVELVVSSTGVEMVRPRSARVSWVRESDPRDVRGSFCRSSRLFATEETAVEWVGDRSGIEILEVDEAARSIRMADLLM